MMKRLVKERQTHKPKASGYILIVDRNIAKFNGLAVQFNELNASESGTKYQAAGDGFLIG